MFRLSKLPSLINNSVHALKWNKIGDILRMSVPSSQFSDPENLRPTRCIENSDPRKTQTCHLTFSRQKSGNETITECTTDVLTSLTSSVLCNWADARQHRSYFFYVRRDKSNQILPISVESETNGAFPAFDKHDKIMIWRNLSSLQIEGNIHCLEVWLYQRNTRLSNFNWVSPKRKSHWTTELQMCKKYARGSQSLLQTGILNWNIPGHSQCYESWKSLLPGKLALAADISRLIRSQAIEEVIRFELWMNGLEEISVLCGCSLSSALEMASGSSSCNRDGQEL